MNRNSNNEDEDLRTRMTKAENKIVDLEELVRTLKNENLELKASLAEIRSHLGLQNNPTQEVERKSLNSRSFHSEIRKSLEKSIEKEEENLTEETKTASIILQRPSEEGSKKASKESGLFKPKRLFENLLVVSVPEKDIPDCLNDSQSEGDSFISELNLSIKKNIQTKVLFNFAESAQMEPNITVPNIEKFITPCDFRVSDLGENPGATEKIFHKTVLKSQRKYTRKYICPFHPHDGILLKWHKEVNTFNPQRKLYAVCIKKSDFLVNNESTPKVFAVDTIYCMLTYYPIPNLIFDLLTSILNLIKKTRSQIYWNSGGKDIEEADFKILQNILLNQVKGYVETLLTIPQPVPCDTIEYLFNNDHMSKQQEVRQYSYSLNSQAYLELASWQASRVFSKFGLENIKFLISALLLEKCIIFISQDIVTVTSVLNTLLGLLHPFKYFHTIVPNLYPQLVRLCGAPMPITICINQKEDYFWETRLHENSRDIFVFLDSQIVYLDKTDSEFSKIPILDCLSVGIEELYKELNPKNSSFDFITNLSELQKTHPIKLDQSVNEKEAAPLDREKCQKLFNPLSAEHIKIDTPLNLFFGKIQR